VNALKSIGGAFGSVAVGQTRRRLSFFVMVLCYSRLMYVEFTVSQTMEHFLACHQHAFEAFGGVPQNVMADNLTHRSGIFLEFRKFQDSALWAGF
jgi:transposase